MHLKVTASTYWQ